MERVLGVDVGTRRTGLAISDALGITCRPLRVVRVTDPADTAQAVLAVAAEERVGMIVVGMPRPLSGGGNEQLAYTQRVVEELEKEGQLPVVVWDERFTTKLARGVASSRHQLDAVAAAFMLQGYLDSRTSPESQESSQ